MERRVSQMETTVEDIDHVLNGNGQKGFINEVSEYISEQRGAWKMLLRLGAVLGFIVAATALLVGWLTYRDARKGELKRPDVTMMQRQDAAAPLY